MDKADKPVKGGGSLSIESLVFSSNLSSDETQLELVWFCHHREPRQFTVLLSEPSLELLSTTLLLEGTKH